MNSFFFRSALRMGCRFTFAFPALILFSFFAAPACAAITFSGFVTPSDPNLWTGSTAAYVGKSDGFPIQDGIGSLVVDNESDLLSGSATLGYFPGAKGSVTVTGTGSTWNNGGGMFLGSYGYGTGVLNVLGGGSVNSSSIGLGCQREAVGAVTVSGTGSVLSSDYINVAIQGTGFLNVTAGGTVKCSAMNIGCDYYSNGSATVSDASSKLSCSGTISVGCLGSGTLTQTGGEITASAFLLGAYFVGSGTYSFEGGTLTASSISKNDGAAVFNFGGGTLKLTASSTVSIPLTLTGTNGNAKIDTNGYAVTLSGTLSGSGGLTKLGSGSLALVGENRFTGETNIVAGTLIAKGSALPNGTNASLMLAGDLSLKEGTKLAFELGADSTSDHILLANSTLHTSTLEFSDFSFTALTGFGEGSFTLIKAAAIDGELGASRTGIIGGLRGTLTLVNNDVVLNVSAVPEPTTFGLLAVAIAGWVVTKRQYNK